MNEHTLSESDQKIIHSDGKNRARWNWFFAILWNAIVFPVMFFQWDELAKIVNEDPIFSVFISFPIIGLFLLYGSIKDAIDWFRFGEAPLTLNTYPVYLGGNISGYIDFNTHHERGVNAEVSLRCSHHYIDHDSNSDNNSATDVLWQDDLLMPTQPQADKTRVLFSFSIDDDLPQSQGKGSERHEWNVVVKLPVRGKNLVRVYIVSVDKHYALPTSKSSPLMKEQLMLNQPKVAAKSVYGPIENSKIKSTGTPQISTTHRGQQFYFPASRNRVSGITCLIASLFFGGVVFFMLSEATDFMPYTLGLFSLPFILVAVILFVVGLLLPLHKLEVVVGRTGIMVRHQVLFYTYEANLATKDIADIQVKRNGSSSGGKTSKVWYQLQAVDVNGLVTTVGDSIAGSSYAKQVRQQMVDALGNVWQPTEVFQQPGKLEKLKQFKGSRYSGWLAKLIPIIFILAIAYDLYKLLRSD